MITIKGKEGYGMYLEPASSEQLNRELVEKMAAGVAHFGFEKSDGSLRNAYGTLNADLIPATASKMHYARMKVVLEKIAENKGITPPIFEEVLITLEDMKKPDSEHKKATGIQIYYDLESNAFRSFGMDKLLYIF